MPHSVSLEALLSVSALSTSVDRRGPKSLFARSSFGRSSWNRPGRPAPVPFVVASTVGGSGEGVGI